MVALAGRRLHRATSWRTWGLTLAFGCAALALYVGVVADIDVEPASPRLSWWMLAPLFYLGEVFALHLPFQRGAHSYTLSEIPLVLALVFATPDDLVVGRLVAALAALGLTRGRRQRPEKLAFNGAIFGLEAVVAAFIFHAVIREGEPVGQLGLLASFAAAAVVSLITAAAIYTAIWVSDERPDKSRALQAVAVASSVTVTNVSLAYVGVVMLAAQAALAWLLVIPAAALLIAHRAFLAERRKHDSLSFLHDATSLVHGAPGLHDGTLALLRQTRATFRAELAEIVLAPSEGEGSTFICTLGPGERIELNDAAPVRGERLAGAQARLVRKPGADALGGHLSAFAVRDAIIAPLVSESGDTVGSVIVANRLGEVDAFDEDDRLLLQTLANHAGVAIDNRRLFSELERREERYRDLFENANDFVFTVDRDLRFTGINGTGERVTGYSRDELAGRSFSEIVSSESQGRALARLESSLAEGADSSAWEVELVAKDGRLVPVEFRARDISRAGESVGLQGIGRDVSERRSLEEQLRHAQKMEAVGRLAGGVAHDFNNLLTAIAGYCELALQRHTTGRSVEAELGEIQRAAERAGSLTQQLLAFSRKQVLQPKVLDLNDAVSDSERLLRRLVGEDVELVTSLAADLGRVHADPGQLQQAVMNLVVNARDAMATGGTISLVTSNVEVQSVNRRPPDARPGSYVVLCVTDTGSGMSSATQAQIFEPFFTTKPTGKGTGLGLAMVYGFLQQSDGWIEVESEPGRGTSFFLFFPRVEAEVEASAPKEDIASNGSSRERILLVEDQDAVRAVLREALEECGYSVLEARHGEEALRLASQHPVRLLVTDVVMPKMSGPELAERLAGLHPPTPVLFISGHADEAIGAKGILAPGTQFLQKPFALSELVATVRSLLDESPA